jgi:hypothetical protein
MNEPYDEDYFLNGVKSGKSNYENYSWRPELTLPMARSVRDSLGAFFDGETVLDVGCARGYLVKALRQIGVDAYGYDISKWAITNCDPAVSGFVSNHLEDKQHHFIFSKDCFEHIPEPDLVVLVDKLLGLCETSMLVIVPLSIVEGGDYVRKEDNMDSTHVIKWPLCAWMDFFQNRAGTGFHVSGSWHIEGLKPTSFTCLKSCGFIRLDRVI